MISYLSRRRGSSLSNTSMHIDDVSVFVAFVIPFVATMFDEDECSELIEGVVDVPAYRWRHSFVVSSTNSYVNWDHVSSFTSKS